MKNSKQTLEKQLAVKENEAELLRNKIAKIKEATKTKNIMDRVKTLKDVLKIAKPSAEEKAIINYSGKSKRMLFAKHIMILSLIAEVLNEGYVFKMDGSEYRYYPYFDVSSGFVFYYSFYGDSGAATSSASRLCVKSQELAEHFGKVFLEYHKNAYTV